MRKYAILCILVLALLPRLHKIGSPIIGGHSWRQGDTAAMARNYFENGYDFLRPQIDWGGDSPGYVECELPVYPFAAALLYGLFGPHEYLGRLLSIFCFLVAAYFLYLLARERTDEKTALWSVSFFCFFPHDIFFSRAFMAESTLLMSLVLGVYFFSRRLSKDAGISSFLLSALFVSLSALIKPPSLYVGLPLAWLAHRRYGWGFLKKGSLWLYALLVFLPVALWYAHARETFLSTGLTFGVWDYGTDKWGNWDLVLTGRYWRRIVVEHLANRLFTRIGFLLFLVGLFLRRKSSGEKLFDYWLLSLLVYFVVVGSGNYVHDYYQLPFMIPGSVYVGKVYGRFFRLDPPRSRRIIAGDLLLAACLAGMILQGVQGYGGYMRLEDTDASPEYKLGRFLARNTGEDALIILVDLGDPSLLYRSRRKGVRFTGRELEEALRYDLDRREGGRLLVTGRGSFTGDRKKLERLAGDFRVLYDDGERLVFALSEDRDGASRQRR